MTGEDTEERAWDCRDNLLEEFMEGELEERDGADEGTASDCFSG